ncbi:MAG: glutaredoxin family protein [Thiohalobacterales bacterium]|nr:glutaredoxin family protein [Thiohalobacterales bacterium]
MSRRLTVYVRRGCHLCTDMVVALYRLQGELGFELTEVDIDRDPALVARYDTLVPVLVGGEAELCHHFLDRARLRAWCGDAASGPVTGRKLPV